MTSVGDGCCCLLPAHDGGEGVHMMAALRCIAVAEVPR
jgi:hypothetical protein